MSKLFQALFSGMFVTFILDFFLFLGIKENYIDFYEIDVYYNILFADHQNIYIFFSLSIVLGFIITYINKTKLSLSIIFFLAIIPFASLIPSVGYSLGEMMLMSKNVTLKDDKYTYIGDIYYDGRDEIVFYDKEIKKQIKLKKELIK
ncbi:MAG: hypothetical protein GXO30_04085 [Epsilonproteobacteria bacterium]|nr:hypothetical protein [Campylobacterota bacterium]